MLSSSDIELLFLQIFIIPAKEILVIILICCFIPIQSLPAQIAVMPANKGFENRSKSTK